MNALAQFSRIVIAATVLAGSLAACAEEPVIAPPESSDLRLERIAPALYRSIDEFVLAQGGGAGTGTSVPPEMVPGAIAWIDRASGMTAVVDFAGAIYRRESRVAAVDTAVVVSDADPKLPPAPSGTDPGPVVDESVSKGGPTFAGSVREQILLDGSARVTVDLATSGALCFAVKGQHPSFDPLAFGARRYGDVEAARGSSHLYLVYRTLTPGAPLPSISELLYMPQQGRRLEYLSFSASASASALSIVSSGTLVVQQPGIRGTDPILGQIGSLPALRVAIE
jgi:hypothetical protein